MRHRHSLYSIVTCFCVALVGCNFASINDGSKSEKVRVNGITLFNRNLELSPGETYEFYYDISPVNATNKEVTWSSSNKVCGDIDENGLFTALELGTTTITATTVDGGYQDQCVVSVVDESSKTIDHISATCSVTTYYLFDQIDKNNITIYAHYTNPKYSPEEITCDFNLDYNLKELGENYVFVEAYIEDKYYLTSFTVNVIDDGKTYLTVDITAFNDFHGAIEQQYGRMGLAKLGTYLKQQSSKANALTLSQGDDWQGSIYSNYNRGRLVNDVYAYAHLSARTVGNHDFDWGVEPLEANTAAGYDNYVTPVLAANIYNYDYTTKTMGNVQQEDIGVPTVTYKLENGLKVGIVGVIGEDQITSITSSYTEDIGFTSHITAIKNYATSLRNDGCDIVIACVHSGQGDVIGNGLEDYVDLVLCGHTHRKEQTVENGLHYYQYAAYGEYIGQIQLAYNIKTHEVTVNNETTITSYTIDQYVTTIDPTITSIINQYNSECDYEANEVLSTKVSGTFDNKEEAPNLMCRAMFEQAVEEGHDDILLAYCNQSRSDLYSGSWTYANIYQAFPFDNVVYIESVKGSDILYEVANYSNVYINPVYSGDISIDSNQYYKIAVLDYLLYHNNSYRYYDYFRAFDGHPDDCLSLNYRVILRKWLRAHKDTNINSSDYSNSLAVHSNSRLVKA